MKDDRQLWCVRGRPRSCRHTRLYTSVYVFPDDGRATNPSSAQETIAQVRPHVPVVREIPPSGITAGSFRGAYLDFFTTRGIQIVKNFESKSESENSPLGDPADKDIELVREAMKTCLNPRIIRVRNASLSCIISLLEQRSKNCIGPTKTLKSLLRSPLLEASPTSSLAPNPGRSREYTLQRVSIEVVHPSNRHDTEYTGIHRMSLDVHQQNVLPPTYLVIGKSS